MNQIEQLEEQILVKEQLDVTQKIQIIPEDLSMYGSSDPQEQQVLRKHQDILEQDYPNQPLCISTRVKQLGYKDSNKGDYQQIGKILKKLYSQEYSGAEPQKREQYVYKAKCSVNCYYYSDRKIMDKAIKEYYLKKKSKTVSQLAS